MNENTVKHLEFIQNVITRMNTNSFQVKVLSVGITTAVLALEISTAVWLCLLIRVIPILFFCWIDAYYLGLERKFRCLYNDVAGLATKQSNIKDFDMSIKKYKCCALARPTIWLFYLFQLFVLVLVCFARCKQ